MLSPEPDSLVYPPTKIIENTPAAVTASQDPTTLYFPATTNGFAPPPNLLETLHIIIKLYNQK
jgi:hypothetical protein